MKELREIALMYLSHKDRNIRLLALATLAWIRSGKHGSS
jgi:hypothetical protein